MPINPPESFSVPTHNFLASRTRQQQQQQQQQQQVPQPHPQHLIPHSLLLMLYKTHQGSV